MKLHSFKADFQTKAGAITVSATVADSNGNPIQPIVTVQVTGTPYGAQEITTTSR